MEGRWLGTTGNAMLLAEVKNPSQLAKGQEGVTLQLQRIGTLAGGKITAVSIRENVVSASVNFVDGSQVDVDLEPTFKGKYLVRMT